MSKKRPMLTPEVIEALAKNAGQLRAAMTTGDEAEALRGNGIFPEAAAPKFIKFKFILCEVRIKNINAVAGDGPQPC